MEILKTTITKEAKESNDNFDFIITFSEEGGILINVSCAVYKKKTTAEQIYVGNVSLNGMQLNSNLNLSSGVTASEVLEGFEACLEEIKQSYI
jgi:hypothetical protein